nr:uncharacterized protein LOC109432086 [Aedes albopictus]
MSDTKDDESSDSIQIPGGEENYIEEEYLESDNDELTAAIDEPEQFRNISVPSINVEGEDLRSSISGECSNSSKEPTENDGGVEVGEQVTFSLNMSAKKYRKYQFHIIGAFYARSFRTQHLSDALFKRDIYGHTLPELHKCIWKHCANFVAREVVVDCSDGDKNVRWASKQTPDVSDIGKYILLKHGKTKKVHTLADLGENTKLLSKWRGSEVQVHVFKHSTAVASNTLWDMVNKKLLHPESKDKTGAPATQEIVSCIEQLKSTHTHYTALYASWEKWANYILAHPGDVRPNLMKDAPPDEYLHLFRSVPVSEVHRLQATRHGLQVAYNIVESISSSINTLCDRVDSVAINVAEVQLQAHELKAQVRASHSLLQAMEASLPPEESEFSRKLASKVTDAIDVDHQE